MQFRRLATIAVGVVLIASAAIGVRAMPVSARTVPPGLVRLHAIQATENVVGIARFSDVPSGATVARLRGLGLRVQAMQHLPLAIVKGSVTAMEQAVAASAADDVYPDERVQLLDTASSDSMNAAAIRAAGFTGKGVTVAVVDSGCDATHPDLADHVAHNVTLVGLEYLNQPPDPNTPNDGALVIPIEQSPYNNSDLGSGHGTHVSGIIAADGTTSPDHLGVAPDATLICYSIGEVLFTTAVISAYDHMLDQENLWNIKVVNNSWGNSFRTFDPMDPVNVATKAVADKGVVVVFASGNAGGENAEVSLNPFSEPPWVISVAADGIDKVRGDFSSNGAQFDNSQPISMYQSTEDYGHAKFTGTRIGVYHPDVTAPGVDISSSCDTTGTVVGPCPPGSNETASGTSMASPHVAGAAAVLFQANPKLTPTELRWALQATATPVTNTEKTGDSAFWQAGYGHVDLAAAVDLVRASNYADLIRTQQRAADARVFAASGYRVDRSDIWTWPAPPATVEGTPDSRSWTIVVPAGTSALKLALAYPSLGTAGFNGMEYVGTITDGAGKLVGTTEANFTNGSSSLFVDLTTMSDLDFSNRWTIQVTGTRAVSDPDTLDSDSALGRMVTITFAQLGAQ